mmetsp:Transcript_1424/g.2078  ORF Transcript_1424/g.2078 Transcript_1424/m.2078 type:complete len:256 (+) Transcript_1424:3135-3902(+)
MVSVMSVLFRRRRIRSTVLVVLLVSCKRVMQIWMMIHYPIKINNMAIDRVGIILVVVLVAVVLVVSRIIMWRLIRSAVKRTILPRSSIWGMMPIAMDGSNAIRPHHGHKHKHKHSHELGISIMVILLQRPIIVRMMILLRIVSVPYHIDNSGEALQRGIMYTKRICSFRRSRDLRFKWSGRRYWGCLPIITAIVICNVGIVMVVGRRRRQRHRIPCREREVLLRGVEGVLGPRITLIRWTFKVKRFVRCSILRCC